MQTPQSTIKAAEGSDAADEAGGFPSPGVLLLFSQGKPRYEPFPLVDGQLDIGRGDGRSAWPTDPRMSRRHAHIFHDGQRLHVEDLGSQNGTFLDGVLVKPVTSSANAAVIRTGDSLFLVCPDLRPYKRCRVSIDSGRVIGPILDEAMTRIAQIAGFSTTLHITGESGVGKEGAAQSFHAAGPQSGGPFIAVNCATIPQGIAERVLFGAKRGAFSGADVDSDGYIQTAHNGTLFLDEIAELDPAVQAKLLRVLETREVCQLGATKPRTVKIQLCSASNKDLRAEVAAGRFREDLYFRLSRPEVELPPLRRRKEEIPWFIDRELRAIPGGPAVQTSFVEACLLRFWPGNVREFLTEVRAAGHMALAARNKAVEVRHLSPRAGLEFIAEPPPEHPSVCQVNGALSRAVIERILQRTGGNISASARLLNMHRTQFKRNIDRLGIDAASFATHTGTGTAHGDTGDKDE